VGEVTEGGNGTCPGQSAHATKMRTQRETLKCPETISKDFKRSSIRVNPVNRKRVERRDRRKIFITLDKIWKSSWDRDFDGKTLDSVFGTKGAGNQKQRNKERQRAVNLMAV